MMSTHGRRSLPRPMFQPAVYRAWFDWLLASDAYIETCESKGRVGTHVMRRIYEDWGDIRRVRFSIWYAENGRRLFGEPVAESSVRLLPAGSRVETGYVAIAIKMGTTWRMAKSRTVRLLKERFPQLPAFKAKKSEALYKVVGKPSIFSLKRTLQVYELVKDGRKKTLVEIADEVGIDGTYANKAAQVSQIIKRALEIMSAVENGQFPKRP